MSARRVPLRLAAALLLALGCALLPAAAIARPPATTLDVFAAASLADAFGEIARVFERRHAGTAVRLNFAGSQQLAAQIEQGAGADVFASADPRWMEWAAERGLIDGAAERFARNRLVVIVPATNPGRVRRLHDLSRGGLKLVIGADAVPVGRYSRMLLARLGRDPAFGGGWAPRVLRNVVSEEENVKSVVAKVQLGEADAGIVYRSDVTRGVARYVKVIEAPDAANILASYPIAVVKDARDAAAARDFIALVRSPEGVAILERHGLMAPATPSP